MKLHALLAVVILCCWNYIGCIDLSTNGTRLEENTAVLRLKARRHGNIMTGHRARRADDRDPLEAVVTQQSTQLSQLMAELAELRTNVGNLNRQVAFRVQITAVRGRTMSKNAPYRFDQIVLNDGNGYDSDIGIFIAPFSEVYMFALQIYTDGGERPQVDILVNNSIVSRMSMDTRNLPDHEVSGFTSVVVKLQPHDRVWVQGTGDSTFWGGAHTFYTGALLYTT